MPGNATTCFSVTDNDAFLSGDSGDKSKDHAGQTAAIDLGGDVLEDVRIFAEVYFEVIDCNTGKIY